MMAYSLYAGAALAAFAVGLTDLRDRLTAFLLVLLSASALLLFALTLAGFQDVIIGSVIMGFVIASIGTYLAANFIQEIIGALGSAAERRPEGGWDLARSAPIRRTAILWLPLVLLMVAAPFATEWVRNILLMELYSVKSAVSHCGDTPYLLCRHSDGSFRGSLHLTNTKFFETTKNSVRDRVGEIQALPHSAEPEFRTAVNDAFFGSRPIIPTKLFDRLSGCSALRWAWPGNWGECIRAEILNPMHDAYADFRKKLQNDLNIRITGEFQHSQTVANNLANVVRLNVDRQLENTRAGLDRGIDRAFFILDVLGILSICTAVLLGLKIFLYILVRLAFDERTAKVGCFLSDPKVDHSRIEACQMTSPQSRSIGQAIKMKVVDERWYVAISSKGAKPQPRGATSWPHFSQLFFRRLFTSKMFFNEYKPKAQISINSYVDNGFCQIELKDSDCIAFSMRSLFAFTSGIRFRLALRLRAAVLLQRRFLFATATGPGTIVLIARGGALAILPNEEAGSSDIDDVIALDMNGSVFTHAETGFIDVYFRSFDVVPCKDTLMVREAPHSPAWALWGLTRRFAALLLPF